jgi:ABC-type spermidine/putrescine transport system permease subunit II
MRSFLFGLLGFVVGLVVTTLAVFFGYVAFTELAGYHDFEGATAMGMATVAPIIGIVGGIAGAFLFAYRFGGKRST